MDILTAIQQRVTAVKLTEPGPSPEQIDRLLAAAARAPDHGRLAPWHFTIVAGAARERLGEVLAAFKQRQKPDCDEAALQAERSKAMRAPVVIVAAARIVPGHKVPEIEQVLAVGSAVQNLLLAAHAMGFGSMWKSGAPAYDPEVKRAFGLEPRDHIVGFIYLGTPAVQVPVRDPELRDRVVRW
jgi:nitroreductase